MELGVHGFRCVFGHANGLNGVKNPLFGVCSVSRILILFLYEEFTLSEEKIYSHSFTPL